MNHSDDSLEVRVAHGDREALAVLFGCYRDKLHHMIRLRLDPRLQSRVDPSDVLQEAFLDADRRLAELPVSGLSPFLWLRCLTGQRLVDVHRHHLGTQKRNAAREISIYHGPMPAVTSASLAAQLMGHTTTASQAAMRAELKLRIQSALSKMTTLDREVLALRHFEGLSNGEAAAVLGISPNAASNRYVRALRRLKEILTEVQSTFDSWWTSE